MFSYPSKLIAIISSALTVEHAVSVCFFDPMLIGPPFGRKRKPQVGLRVYTKAVEVASASWSSGVDSMDAVSVFSHRCPSLIASV